jgi:hypothetical protein
MDTTSAPQPVDLSSVELGMSVKGGEGYFALATQ